MSDENTKELEQRIKSLEDLEKSRADEAEKAFRDEKYRLSMLGHENMRWDFSDYMYLLPTDENNNDIRLQQSGLNQWLWFDRWGLNPDFIKRFPNKIVNSGFEWYDIDSESPDFRKPLFWEGEGRVTDASNWEGTVALELQPGQTIEQGTLAPIFPGTKAGADPAWWDDDQTRVSFKHKGGAVRVRVQAYDDPEGGGLLDPTSWTTWRTFVGASPARTWGNMTATADRRAVCIYVESGAVKLAYASSVTEVLSGATTLDTASATTLLSGLSEAQSSIDLIDGKLNVCITYINSTPRLVAEFWRDTDGNGTGMAKVSDISTDLSSSSAYAPKRGCQPSMIHKLGGGALVVMVPYQTWIRNSMRCCYSANDGATWSQGGIVGVGLGDHLSEGESKSFLLLDDTSFATAHLSSSGSGWLAYFTNNGANYERKEWTHDWGGWPMGEPWFAAFIRVKDVTYMCRYSDAGIIDVHRLKSATPTLDNIKSISDWDLVKRVGADSASMQSHFTLTNDCLILQHSLHGNRISGAGTLVAEGGYWLVDNHEEGLVNKYGIEVGVIQGGVYLDYSPRENWAYNDDIDPTTKLLHEYSTDEEVNYVVFGYHTFYFQPIVGKGRVKVKFENIDAANPCYIDAVQIEPDFSGKWPSFYTKGPRSIPVADIIGMPGLGQAQENPVTRELELIPNPHAPTHATGGSDELAPADIGAAEELHVHEKMYYHGNLNVHQAVEIMLRGGLGIEEPIKTAIGTVMGWKMPKGAVFYISDRVNF